MRPEAVTRGAATARGDAHVASLGSKAQGCRDTGRPESVARTGQRQTCALLYRNCDTFVTKNLGARAPLWGGGPSAIMRRHRRIRGFLGVLGRVAGASGLAVFAFTAWAEERTEPLEASSGTEDTAAVWLPDPAAALDEPERIEEPAPARVRVHVASGGRGAAARRLWWKRDAASGWREVAIGGSGPLATIRSMGAAKNGPHRVELGANARAGLFDVAAGDLALEPARLGLMGEMAGWSRRSRSVTRGWRGGGARRVARPALGGGIDLTGWVLERRGIANLAGGFLRRREGRGLAATVGAGKWFLQGAVVRTPNRQEGFVGATVAMSTAAGRTRKVERRAVVELAGSPAGLSGRILAGAREGPFRAEVVWRHEAGRDRPGALDLESAWVAREAAARFRWRSWSSQPSLGARGLDDGRAELDLRAGRGGPGAWLLRLGSRPVRPGGGGERYALGELVVARERDRSFRLSGGARRLQSGDAGAWRVGRSLGAALRLGESSRTSLSLTLEAVRAAHGAGAYGRRFAVDEGGSLRTRTRSGIRAAARGSIGFGDWRVGLAVDDEKDGIASEEAGGRTREPRVNVWMEWGTSRSGEVGAG